MKKGIESLKVAVQKDCQSGQNCFNENGCDKTGSVKCFHRYCDKYKWILERAKHYAEKTGKEHAEIITSWEEARTYWYMNYYQESNQPKIEGENILFFEDWKNTLIERFGKDPKKWAFVCPQCKSIQTVQDFYDLKVENPESVACFSCIGRYTKQKGCDWTLGGLLSIHKQTVIKDGRAFPVFEIAPAK